jgi:hypothetical protein
MVANLNLNKMISDRKDIWVQNTTSDKKVSIRIEGSQTMYPSVLPSERRCLTDELSYEQIDKSDVRQMVRKGFLILLDPEEMVDVEHVTPKIETPEVSAEELKKTRVKSSLIPEGEINPRIQQIKLWFARETDKGTAVPEFDGRNTLEELKRMEPGLSENDLGYLLGAKKLPPAIKKWTQEAIDRKQQQAVPAATKNKGARADVIPAP